MKKLLLSLSFIGALTTGMAQIAIPMFNFNDVPAASAAPILQGSAGTYEVQGTLLPRVQGDLTDVFIAAVLTASVDGTYANDITILVTETENIADATGYMLQVGGFSTFVPTNKHDWPCGATCDDDVAGTPVSGLVDAFAAISFTGNSRVIWILNGYINDNPPTNEGSWTVNELIFGGLSVAIAGIETAAITAKVYPNPAADVLNISVAEPMASIELVGVDGRIVLNTSASGLETTVDVSGLRPGVYYYTITTENGNVARNSFVKK